MSNEFVAKKGIVSKANAYVSGSVTASLGFSGNLQGTASFTTTASFSNSASFAFGLPSFKAGIVSGSAFTGSTRTASVNFVNPYPNTNYSIVVTGENSRTWTVQSKTTGSFVINSNASAVVSNSVYWQTMTVGEFY